MDDRVASSDEPRWYLAVQGETVNVALMIGGSFLVLYWVLSRTQAAVVTTLGAMLGALVGIEIGRLEARYVIEGLRTSGTVTRTWKDPNPAGILATLIPLLIAILAGFATQSGISGFLDLTMGSGAFFLLQGSFSAAVAVIALWGFEHASGQRVKERMIGGVLGSGFEYTVETGSGP